jgi:hypothetical protein
MIAETGSRPSAVTPFPEASPTFSPAFFFPRGASLAAFGEPGEQEYQFEGDGAIYPRLFPKFDDAQPQLGRVGLRTLVHNRRALAAMAASPMAGIAAPNDHGYVVFEPFGNTTTKGITQAFLTGELWGINSQVFQTVRISRRFRGPDESATVPWASFQLKESIFEHLRITFLWRPFCANFSTNSMISQNVPGRTS